MALGQPDPNVHPSNVRVPPDIGFVVLATEDLLEPDEQGRLLALDLSVVLEHGAHRSVRPHHLVEGVHDLGKMRPEVRRGRDQPLSVGLTESDVSAEFVEEIRDQGPLLERNVSRSHVTKPEYASRSIRWSTAHSTKRSRATAGSSPHSWASRLAPLARSFSRTSSGTLIFVPRR